MQLRFDRRQPVHVAQGDFGRDIRNQLPRASTTFTDVGVKKKSFCGSIDSDKPCLHVDFGKFGNANVPAIEALIGTRYVTLNNSIQDKSYIKQTLGYRLLEMAGLPHSRCNFARVFVNGTLIGQGVGGVNSPGIYVNAEPIMKRYIERNFNGNMKGNLYEIEHHDDFVEERLKFIGVEVALQIRGQSRSEIRVPSHQSERAGWRGPGARYRPVPQDLCDGVLSQALGRLCRQHQQHLHLQRRDCRRGARRGQHQVQDDPVGYRPDTCNPTGRSSWAAMG